MHKSSQVKFVLRDEDIQVWWGQLVFRLSAYPRLCLSTCPWDGEVKKLPPPRIISGTALSVMDFDIKF